LIIAFILSTICIVFNYLNVFPLSNSQTFATQETKANIAEDMINNTNEESTLIEIESNQKEDTKVEIQLAEAEEEDGNIKTLLQNIQTENNLNDKNFSFFYYNIDKQKYYFYNENTYFTAASTVKVPIAMYHYDEIKNGNLTPKDKFLYTSNCYEKGNGTTNVTYSVGQSIPVNFLLKQSIVNSDNTATNILKKEVSETTLNAIEIDSETNPTIYSYDKYITILHNGKLEIYNNYASKVNEIEVGISNPIFNANGTNLLIAEKDRTKNMSSIRTEKYNGKIK